MHDGSLTGFLLSCSIMKRMRCACTRRQQSHSAFSSFDSIFVQSMHPSRELPVVDVLAFVVVLAGPVVVVGVCVPLVPDVPPVPEVPEVPAAPVALLVPAVLVAVAASGGVPY